MYWGFTRCNRKVESLFINKLSNSYICVSKHGHMGYIAYMKTTIDISDSILLKAKQLAREQNVTLRSFVEEGEGLSPQFQGVSWAEVRDAAYEGRGA